LGLGGWLRSLGLERYEAAFRENEIDDTVLPGLTHGDLKEIGVGPVCHCRKLLDAIAGLRADAKGKALSSDAVPTVDTSPKNSAERRQVTVMFGKTQKDPGTTADALAALGRTDEAAAPRERYGLERDTAADHRSHGQGKRLSVAGRHELPPSS
jgi:hypothetical protein